MNESDSYRAGAEFGWRLAMFIAASEADSTLPTDERIEDFIDRLRRLATLFEQKVDD